MSFLKAATRSVLLCPLPFGTIGLKKTRIILPVSWVSMTVVSSQRTEGVVPAYITITVAARIFSLTHHCHRSFDRCPLGRLARQWWP
jgi:hypothetical protein